MWRWRYVGEERGERGRRSNVMRNCGTCGWYEWGSKGEYRIWLEWENTESESGIEIKGKFSCTVITCSAREEILWKSSSLIDTNLRSENTFWVTWMLQLLSGRKPTQKPSLPDLRNEWNAGTTGWAFLQAQWKQSLAAYSRAVREGQREKGKVCEGGKQRRRKGVYFNSITQECHVLGGSFSCRVMKGMVIITGVTWIIINGIAQAGRAYFNNNNNKVPSALVGFDPRTEPELSTWDKADNAVSLQLGMLSFFYEECIRSKMKQISSSPACSLCCKLL